MAKVKIAGSACVIESAHTLKEIHLLEKFRPKALRLYDEENKEETFAVGTSKGYGSICSYGVSFGATESNEKASVTLIMEPGVEDPAAWAEERIGVAIINLNKVEAQFAGALAEVEAEKALVRESIAVV